MTNAAPLMKWPGGKRRVLPELLKYIPSEYSTYYEPFFGGGALFFNLAPHSSVISDINWELINLYTVAKDNPEELIKELTQLLDKNTLEDFLAIRAWDRAEDFSSRSAAQKAARTLFLNKTCFNGLYRVNSQGLFNVPYGKYANPRILDADNIRAVSQSFIDANTDIRLGGYETVLSRIEGTKNFIYLDPPYVPLTETSSFVSYTKEGFDMDRQRNLTEYAEKLDAEGNFVLISNSDTVATRELYKNFTLVPIRVSRSVGANANSRVQVGEVLAVGKTLARHLSLI